MLNIKTLNKEYIKEELGYDVISTYYEDFGIAEHYGTSAIEKTYNRVINDNLGYKYLTELVLVLNWKIWEHYGSNDKLGKLYNSLWEKAREYAISTLKDDELAYYITNID